MVSLSCLYLQYDVQLTVLGASLFTSLLELQVFMI